MAMLSPSITPLKSPWFLPKSMEVSKRMSCSSAARSECPGSEKKGLERKGRQRFMASWLEPAALFFGRKPGQHKFIRPYQVELPFIFSPVTLDIKEQRVFPSSHHR